MNIIEQYLIEKGIEYKQVNGQFNLKISPISGEEKRHHFYLDASSGLRDDKKTGKSGNFNQFRDFYGDEHVVLETQEVNYTPKEYRTLAFETIRLYQQRLRGLEQESVKYLKEGRGLEEKTIKNFKLGAENGRIAIPIFDSKDTLVNIRRRKSPIDTNEDMPKYYSETGCKSILFNEAVLLRRPKEIIIVEGMFDAMVLWQSGLTNVISGTLGAGYFPEEWVDMLKDVRKVFICYDQDSAGVEGAKKVAEKIGSDRCRIIDIPKPIGAKKQDISDWFKCGGGSRDAFVKLMNESKVAVTVNTEAVKHISDFNDELRNRLIAGDYTGISTGYAELDKIIGGYRKGRVIVLSGLTSVGKTSYSLNLSLSLAYRKVPLLFISMEMPPIDICRKFLMMHKKINGREVDTVVDGTSMMNTIDKGLTEFKGDEKTPGMPIYIYDNQGASSIRNVVEICRFSKETKGVEVIVIDHLHYFASDSKNRTAEVSNIMRQIKNMAMELDIPVILLAHLNRGGRQQQRRGLYIPTLSDLRESGSIEQDADQVIFVCRDSESVDSNEKRKSVIKVSKNRDGKTGHVSNDFDLDIGFFSELVGIDYLQEEDRKMKDTSKSKTKEIIKPENLPF